MRPDSPGGHDRPAWPRRKVLKIISAAGVGSAVFGRAVVALADGKARVTESMIRRAEWISGLSFTGADRELMVQDINETLEGYAKLRAVSLDNGVAPALRFESAAPPARPVEAAAGGEAALGAARPSPAAAPGGAAARRSSDEVAFMSVAELGSLLRSGAISSVELTRLYLDRLRRFDPVLQAVVTYTEELAVRQAEAADRELAAGRDRGPLHGIPWGAKDLLAVPGYRTTWGAAPYKDQVRAETATVAGRLERAGAVLVAKLAVGALAWGDVWFGGTTKNPWKTDQGSSGSSAGSAAATAAGLVGFAIGTETWGSIVSPCTRCGATGLRPTFGRVSRHGAMALSWSMDKVGPIARSAEDCALIFAAIQGPDGKDLAVVERSFDWPPRRDVRSLRVGVVEALFEEDRAKQGETEEEKAGLREWQEFDRRTLATLRDLGVTLVPIQLPARHPIPPLSVILTAEAASAFDELTRSGRDDLLTRQERDAWPNVFRQGQLIPAVEYIRANRVRTLVMRDMEEALGDVDVYVTPSYGGDNLLLTNLTGHPSVVAPNGFRSADGTPTSITFMGRLHAEPDVLALARAYQEATDFHRRRPPLGTDANASAASSL